MTTAQQQEFIAAMMPHAIEASRRTGVDPRIIIAQAAQETGWGRSAPNNNYFGVKSHGRSGGSNQTTHEYVNGQRVTTSDSFRGYESMGDSVQGYADFLLENPRYRTMMQSQGLDAQVAALGESGYATDPNYAASVGSIARNIQVPSNVLAASTPGAVSWTGGAPQLRGTHGSPSPSHTAPAPAGPSRPAGALAPYDFARRQPTQLGAGPGARIGYGHNALNYFA